MRTRTIYNAMQNAEREMKYLLSRYRAGPFKPTALEARKGRQFVIFERELLRRMDERDAWKTMFPVSTPIQVAIGLVTAHVEREGK